MFIIPLWPFVSMKPTTERRVSPILISFPIKFWSGESSSTIPWPTTATLPAERTSSLVKNAPVPTLKARTDRYSGVVATSWVCILPVPYFTVTRLEISGATARTEGHSSRMASTSSRVRTSMLPNAPMVRTPGSLILPGVTTRRLEPSL